MVSTHEQEMAIYLERVATGLHALPDEAREAEIEEIEQHLHALVAAHVELGLPQKEATRAALRQFGAASQVARTLVRAWKRGQKRMIPGTLAGAFGWGVAASIAAMAIQFVLNYLFVISLGSPTLYLALRAYGVAFACALLTGYVAGRMAPRYALQGSFLAWLMFLALNVATFFTSTLPHIPAESQSAFLPRYFAMWMGISGLGLGIRLLGAHLGRQRCRVVRGMRLVG